MIKYRKPLIVIAGPTASGKSSLALQLAKDIHGEIINADSRQIYKEISIGTAKPTKEEMQDIKHHLYGHISVKEKYNIYQYQKDVQKVLDQIPSNKVPILVGGTGLYIDSIVFNYQLSLNSTEKNEREELNKKDIEELKAMIHPEIYNNLNVSDKKNPVRLIRIIERREKKERKGIELKHKYFVIDLPRDTLRKRIHERTESMISKGLIEENEMTRKNGWNNYPALRTIGYQEFDGYFEKEKSLEEVKTEITNHTNQYAKRQRTWFKKNEKSIWTNDYDFIFEESLKLIKTE